MTVEFSFTKSGKVLPAAEHSGRFKSGQKFSRIRRNLVRIGGNDARSHDASGYLESQIQHGSKIDVESESATVIADDLSVPAEELGIIGGEHLCRGWSRPECISKPIYSSAFQVNAGEQRSVNCALTVAEKVPGLQRIFDVARKENDAGRLYSGKQGSE